MNKLLLTVSVLMFSSSLVFADIAAPPPAKSKEAIREEIKEHMEQVKAACSADVAATGCSGEGRELMKCVREYKKKNKDFKFSEGCQSAMKSGHEMRKERKMARKAHKKGQKSEEAAPADTK